MDALALLFFVTTILFGAVAAPAFMPRQLEFRTNLRRLRRMQLMARCFGIPAVAMVALGVAALVIHYAT